MKNYLCINGKKTELTKEQMKQLGILKAPVATISADGETVKIGEYEFIVLKKDETLGTVELLLKGTLGDKVFGNTNDYKTSSIRQVVEAFGEEIAELVGEDNLLEHTVDLVTVSGLKDYGSIKAKMSLLTFDKARENIQTLDKHNPDCWWWLATATSTKKHGIEHSVSCVAPGGYINYIGISRYFSSGVRPFCVLKSCIFES